jgi:SagB-type dehydrogenase family enzyme
MPYQRSKEEVEAALADHDYLRGVGSFSMQHSLVSIYATSTVVRTPDTVLRGRWAAEGSDLVGEQMLLNYRTDNASLGFQLGIGRFYEPDAVLTSCHADLEEDLRDAIALPAPKRLRTGLTAAVTARRSTRAFSGAPVSLADLSCLLHHAQGISGELPYGNPADPHGVIKLRTAPSGGGLDPVTVFVQALAVDGLAPGSYEYLPYARALRPVRLPGGRTVDPTELYASPDLDITRAGLVLTFVYNLHHNSRKYGDGGVVFGLIEVGAILQNVHLARTALALAGCDQGGYDKQRIERALGLDGHTRHVVHVSVIGQEG